MSNKESSQAEREIKLKANVHDVLMTNILCNSLFLFQYALVLTIYFLVTETHLWNSRETHDILAAINIVLYKKHVFYAEEYTSMDLLDINKVSIYSVKITSQ